MAPHCSTCCCQMAQISLDTPELPDVVKTHLSSNEPPSASDLPMLRKYRLSLDPYLIRLDTEIAALSAELDHRQAYMNALRTERQALEEHQQRVYGALSPLRRLPLETLQEVFLCTLARSSEPDHTWFDVFNPEDSPWAVRRVSQKWRAATQYPHLWTGLRISRTGLGNLSVVRDVLDRSRSLPLRIRFSWNEFPRAGELGVTVLGELVKHSERWQYASFLGVGPTCIQPISALRGRLPKLETLDLNHCSLTLSDFAEDGHPFEITPSLTKATMNFAAVKLDYSRLESYTSNVLTPAAFEVLVSSPYLTYLADHSCADGPPQDKTRYLHSRLNALLLIECAQLDMFTLPNLQDLEVGKLYANELESPSLPIISRFLHISQCPLLSLTIHNCKLSTSSMPELLQLVPRLQSLSINIIGYAMAGEDVASTDKALNVLIRCLAERASSGLSLVANLRSFAFKSLLIHSWRFMDASIVDMIRVRSNMESVSFTIHPQSLLPNLSGDDVARLRALKNDGFKVSIVKQEGEHKGGSVFI